jgi:hypothetical protein
MASIRESPSLPLQEPNPRAPEGKGHSQPLLREAWQPPAEALDAAEGDRLPIALKATDNSAAAVSPVSIAKDLTRAAFQHATRQRHHRCIVIVEELLLPQPGPSPNNRSRPSGLTANALAQLGGSSFRKDFDSVAHPGASDDPTGNFLGHRARPFESGEHGAQIGQDVEALVRRAGEAIGMGTQKGGHILKADIVLTTKGPIILELTPRLSGGWDSALSTPERGADFIGGALRLALGEKLDEEVWQHHFAYRKPERESLMLTKVRQEAQDCIGREFAWGAASRTSAISNAYGALTAGHFVR